MLSFWKFLLQFLELQSTPNQTKRANMHQPITAFERIEPRNYHKRFHKQNFIFCFYVLILTFNEVEDYTCNIPRQALLNYAVSPEAVAQRCSVKKVFLEISKIHGKIPVPEPLF